MIARRAAMAAIVAVGTGLGALAPVGAQNPPTRVPQEQQQMLRLQTQATQLNEAIQRMTRIHERAQLLEREMAQEMTRTRQQESAEQALMLRSQERLRTMAQALGEGAGEVQRAMEQFHLMMGEPGPGWDAEMERDFVRLRAAWEETAQRMEEGLTIMERLRERLGEPDGSQQQ